MKTVNNAMNAGVRLGTLEVAALGRKAGLSLQCMIEVLNKGSARNQTTEKMLPAIAEGKASTNFALSLMLKDVNLALALATGAKVPTPMLQETQRTYDEAVRGGWGKEDFSAVTHVVETRIGRKVSERK